MLGFDLPVRFLLLFGFLHRSHLRFGENPARLLSEFGLQSFQPALESLEVVAQPDTPHPCRGDKRSAPGQFVGNPHLAVSGLLDGHRDDCLLDVGLHPVLQHRLALADFFQRQLAAFFVELFETVKAIARIAHHLAGHRHTSQHLGKVQEANLVLDDLLICVHLTFSSLRVSTHCTMSDQVETSTVERRAGRL